MTLRIDKRWMRLILVPLALGCGRRSDQPATYPVSGRVLFEGKPVDAADVAFVPKTARPQARPARGRTNAAGEFRLRTYLSPSTEVAGAIADQYTVTVSKIDAPPAGVIDLKQKPRVNLLPARYSIPEKSDLSAEVTSGGANRFEFNVRK
jgi:hypothetical protein